MKSRRNVTRPSHPPGKIRATTTFWLAAAVCLAWSGICHAQDRQDEGTRYTLVARGIPLNKALEELARTSRIDLVYTSDDVAGKVSYCSARSLPAPEVLHCILDGTGLDFVRSSSGAFVLIRSVQEPVATGHLAGRIVDASSGEPLPFATVLLADVRSGTSTGSSGDFSFASLISGRHRLVVTYVGYETARDSVWVDPGKTAHVNIALEPASTTLAPIVIDGLTQRLPSSSLGSGALSSRSLQSATYAATSDVARGLTRIPGVSTQQPLADLHIQGGATGEHATLLDGVPVRDPVSLGRYLSAFSPMALGRITLHKAGFAASRGSHLSGVIDVEHDLAGLGRGNLAASIDPISANARAEGGFEMWDGRRAAFMLAARSSVWDAYRDPGVRQLLESWHDVDPVMTSLWLGMDLDRSAIGSIAWRDLDVDFSDLHAAVRMPVSAFRTWHASAYRARNFLGAEYAAKIDGWSPYVPQVVTTRDEYDWTNWVAQVTHHWILGARAALSSQMQGSWNDAAYAYLGQYGPAAGVYDKVDLLRAADSLQAANTEPPSTDAFNHIRELAWKNELAYSLSPTTSLDAGVSITHIKSSFSFGNPFVFPIEQDMNAWQIGSYLEGSHNLGIRTIIEPGLRLTYIPNRNTVYAEPRLAVRHDASMGSLGDLAVRVAGGLYRQFINQFDLTSAGATTLVPTTLLWLPTDASLAPPRAYHLSLEALWLLDHAWTIEAETYYKWQQRILMLDYATLAQTDAPPDTDIEQADFVAASRGRSAGASIAVRRESGRVQPSFTYSFTYTRRRYPNRFDDRMVAVPWHAPHRIELGTTVQLLDGLSAVGVWDLEWRKSWPLRQSYYDYVATGGADPRLAFIEPDQEFVRIPSYRRLDAGVTYSIDVPPAGVDVRLFVTNLLNRRNIYDYGLEYGVDGLTPLPRRLPGRHLFFAVTVTI